MILAVLEARCSMNFSSHDVYLNIAGGLKITEPAADLAVAMAVISSLTNKPLPADKNYELSCYEIGNVHRLINWFN